MAAKRSKKPKKSKKNNVINKNKVSKLDKKIVENKETKNQKESKSKNDNKTKKDNIEKNLPKAEKQTQIKDKNKDIDIDKEETQKVKIEKKLKENLENKTNFKNVEETEENDNFKTEFKKENLKEKKTKKKRIHIFIFSFIFIILLITFSTIFALLNIDSVNMVKGLKIKNIDISNLSVEEAKNKIEESLKIELMQDLNIKYEDKYEINLESTQIEFTYDIEKAIKEAYKVGRSGNIIKDNYTLLYVAFIGKNIDVNYTYNQEILDGIIEDMEKQIPGVVTQVSYYIEENNLIINKGIDGIGIDKEVFKTKILENIQKRNAEAIINGREQQKVEIPVISKKADAIDIEKIYKEIYTEPKDAYYELEPFNIYPEVNGVDLEISLEEAKKQIESEEKNEYIFNLKITPAEKTIKSFGIEAFPEIVSSFSTKYDARNINRSKNLEIAAGKINGLVLMPEEVFSFNKVVGKRTVEEGYRDAKIYQDGGVVDGLAGGICQISSTLYNAVLLANLEIVERRNHSFTTSYVPAGRDATVVYGTTDFQFKNSRTYPIKIEASVSGGVATFKIHSVALEENEYEIKIKPVITQSIPYATEYIPDPALMPGQQVITQKGQPGYRVTTYKELIQNGTTISNEVISNDIYRAMRSIIKTGP